MIKRPDCFDFAMDFLGDWEATEIRRYVEGLETDARKVPDDGLASFAEYFCHNYPSDTIIGRPEWHAPKIFRAAIYAINDAAKRNAAPPARECALTQAANDVLSERARQIAVEGWTPQHDDEHTLCQLAVAASCYAQHAAGYHIPNLWPWDRGWWKPDSPRRNLVKAGALILAEIERLDRAGLAAGAAPERPHAIEIDVYGGPEAAPAQEPGRTWICQICGKPFVGKEPHVNCAHAKPAAEPCNTDGCTLSLGHALPHQWGKPAAEPAHWSLIPDSDWF